MVTITYVGSHTDNNRSLLQKPMKVLGRNRVELSNLVVHLPIFWPGMQPARHPSLEKLSRYLGTQPSLEPLPQTVQKRTLASTMKTFFVYLKFKIRHVHPTQISELWNSLMSAVSCPDLSWYKPSRILNQPKVTLITTVLHVAIIFI